MKPALAALRIRDQITEYLATTYGLSGDAATELRSFLTDPETGIVKGPYLRIRTPFRPAEPGWETALDWFPTGFTPHHHQAESWLRLSSKNQDPQPTIVTTGTGSGKTESFLIPVLDHCLREFDPAKPGVKAVLLYPMNALATDQANRLNKELRDDPALANVTAGLYIGGKDDTSYERVLTKREHMRANPPDILVTNYKMLDLLLQRPADAPLFSPKQLAYAVVDEFHTYDGAQGTDVSMLLRRLTAAVGDERSICPVATSATLASGDDSSDIIREVAEEVFGVAFSADSVITENRLRPDEFITELDDGEFDFEVPHPDQVLALDDPFTGPDALNDLMELVCAGRDLDGAELGSRLKRHQLTKALLKVFSDGKVKGDQAIYDVVRHDPLLDSWRVRFRSKPDEAIEALSRVLALFSIAKDPEAPKRPLLKVETHLWIKVVNRLQRRVSHEPGFMWEADISAETGIALPAIYCRHCNRSGWAAISPEADKFNIDTNVNRIYQYSVHWKNRSRIRALMPATKAECDTVVSGDNLLTLDFAHLRPFDPSADIAVGDSQLAEETDNDDPKPPASAPTSIPVWVNVDEDKAAKASRCPACNRDNGIRFIGTGAATLSSVVITDLFTRALESDVDGIKSLVFNDSVQDAAQRAGFLSARSHAFSLRSHLAKQLDAEQPVELHELVARAVERLPEIKELSAVIPSEFHDRSEVSDLLDGTSSGKTEAWKLVAERIAFDSFLEFGLRSRSGRTLEATGTAAVEVALPDEEKLARLSQDLLLSCQGDVQLEESRPDAARFAAHIRGILERMRVNGAIKHRWLNKWIRSAGTKQWSIWGGRADGMPAFPDGVSRPEFVIGSDKARSQFSSVERRGTWFADWTRRCLQVSDAVTRQFLPKLFEMLVAEGVVASRVAEDHSTRVYGLMPGQLLVHYVPENQTAYLRCEVCEERFAVPPVRLEDWAGVPCMRWRCHGQIGLVDEPGKRTDFYRDIYLHQEVFRVLAEEHTSVLTRDQREKVERGFQSERHDSPNVLSATSTLELGIDIGDLSAVILAGVPPTPAGFVQRAGRGGRKTGNALTVTVADRRPRDRFFFDDPEEMMDGTVKPPGAYLAAVEILRRQYVAFLLDKVGRGELSDVPQLPHRAPLLFGSTGWLMEFMAVVELDAATLASEFLDLFGDKLPERVREAVHAWASTHLRKATEAAETRWETKRAHLVERIADIERAAEGMAEDSDSVAEVRQLRAEARSVKRHLRDMGTTTAHSLLVEYGLLPNYALVDEPTHLEATLTTKTETEQGDTEYTTELREYARPAQQALRELAPGNSYYARGYRHEITGLDIGTTNSPSWVEWRYCSSCSYVRTENARLDGGPCPRCKAPLNDTGQLLTVLKPQRAFADERQDNARIRDDNDDRSVTMYSTATTVDIDTADRGWRHEDAVFGADYATNAVVRTFNFGTMRPERGGKRTFAGNDIDVTWFWACPICGGTGVDDDPETRPDVFGGSAAEPNRAHHRRWCANRSANTGHQQLALAHELDTEALRILLPVSTVMAEEKLKSFQAALQLGIHATYKGNPDHIASTTAHMTDMASKEVRNFVVLYDKLPSGTGYLERLSRPEDFHQVLHKAKEILDGCEHETTPACHRCLYAHTRPHDYDKVSKRTATELLEEVLDNWETAEVSGVTEISLLRLTESELEARYIAKLKEWAADTDGVNLKHFGRAEGEITIDTDNGESLRWHVHLQKKLGGTVPDVLFTRLDAEPTRIALYLDGYRYHASPEHNRISSDAYLRNVLHAKNIWVFAATWDDVETWMSDDATATWPPLTVKGRYQTDRNFYSAANGDDRSLTSTVWANPLHMLVEFLSDPHPQKWNQRVNATLEGLVFEGLHSKSSTNSTDVAGHLRAALDGKDLPESTTGRLHVLNLRDSFHLPIVACLDTRTKARQFTAIALLDDSPKAVANFAELKPRWKSWLYWANLLQFLAYSGGDGMQLATSDLATFDPNVLQVSDGTGLLLALADEPPIDLGVGGMAETSSPNLGARVVAGDTGPSTWTEVDESFLSGPTEIRLARGAQELGLPEPELGVDHVGGYVGEFIWSAQKVAVIAETADSEEAVKAYREAGWDARTATDWDIESLAIALRR